MTFRELLRKIGRALRGRRIIELADLPTLELGAPDDLLGLTLFCEKGVDVPDLVAIASSLRAASHRAWPGTDAAALFRQSRAVVLLVDGWFALGGEEVDGVTYEAVKFYEEVRPLILIASRGSRPFVHEGAGHLEGFLLGRGIDPNGKDDPDRWLHIQGCAHGSNVRG